MEQKDLTFACMCGIISIALLGVEAPRCSVLVGDSVSQRKECGSLMGEYAAKRK